MLILDGLDLVAAARKMMGQFGDVIVERRSVDRFNGMTHMLVQPLAALEEHGVVSHFLGERVLEDVFDVDDGRLLVDELAQLQPCDQAFQFVLGLARDGTRQTKDELTAEDRERLQQVLLVIV